MLGAGSLKGNECPLAWTRSVVRNIIETIDQSVLESYTYPLIASIEIKVHVNVKVSPVFGDRAKAISL